jgi:hypothetical protein
MIGLRKTYMAQFSNLCSFDASVFIDVVEHHLLLLDRRKPGLTDVFLPFDT